MSDSSHYSRTFFVAGTRFHQMKERDVAKRLAEGTGLKLEQEPTNPYDPNAVKILYEDFMLGYVPKVHSSEVSAMMDVSNLKCKITSLDFTRPSWEWCEVEVED